MTPDTKELKDIEVLHDAILRRTNHSLDHLQCLLDPDFEVKDPTAHTMMIRRDMKVTMADAKQILEKLGENHA